MPPDPRQRRAALLAFMKTHKLKPFPLSKAAGRSEGMLRGFLSGATTTLTDKSYDDLAEGASKLLRRKVTTAMLRGEQPLLIELPVQSYVGAGATIFAIDADGDVGDPEPAPPGFEGWVAQVRGESGEPMFSDGDMLFIGPGSKLVEEFVGKIAVVQVKNGPRLVKRVLHGKGKRYDLQSINPNSLTLTDQPIVEAAPIRWIKRRG